MTYKDRSYIILYYIIEQYSTLNTNSGLLAVSYAKITHLSSFWLCITIKQYLQSAHQGLFTIILSIACDGNQFTQLVKDKDEA